MYTRSSGADKGAFNLFAEQTSEKNAIEEIFKKLLELIFA